MPARRKILVVDDEVIVRDLLKTVLERADYDVILAEDGLSGLEKATSERPDLVIVDGLLPRLHGFLACRAIKKLNPAPKVILLTGIYTKMTYKWEVKREYDADDLLTKPAKPADLLACIAKHLADLPPVERVDPLQPSASTDQSSAISRLLESDVNRPGDSTPPAGYSANWKRKVSPKERLVPSN
jgi:two-component system OmpR family response regulator